MRTAAPLPPAAPLPSAANVAATRGADVTLVRTYPDAPNTLTTRHARTQRAVATAAARPVAGAAGA